jgi:hypothetical protein
LSRETKRRDKTIDKYTHTNNGRQRTTFRAEKADDTEKFNRLWKYQNDYPVVRNSENVFDGRDTRGSDDKKRVVEAYASQLGVSDSIIERSKSIAVGVDGRRFNKHGGLRSIALAAIVVAQNETLSDFSNRIQSWENNDGDRIVQQLAYKEDIDLQQSLSLIKTDDNYTSP